jgi:membrane protein YdbS with pleckstrin-like domain
MVHDERTPQARLAPAEDEQHAVHIGHGFSTVDLRRVRRYLLLATLVPALLLMVAPVLISLFLSTVFDIDIGTAWIVVSTGVLLAGSVLLVIKTERGLRSYYVLLAHDALVYEFGRSRTFLDLEQVQIVDTESSFLLRIFGLCRLSLHTAGGIVSVSPLPVWVAPVVEEHIQRLSPAASRAS